MLRHYRGGRIGQVGHRQHLDRRRTERLLLMLADESIFFTVTGSKQEVIQEQASSMVVNAHGGLAMLRTKVVPGQILTVMNKRDSQKAQSRVVWTRESHEDQSLVAFEFSQPTPSIWPVILPPGDWNQWGERAAEEASGREDSPV